MDVVRTLKAFFWIQENCGRNLVLTCCYLNYHTRLIPIITTILLFQEVIGTAIAFNLLSNGKYVLVTVGRPFYFMCNTCTGWTRVYQDLKK